MSVQVQINITKKGDKFKFKCDVLADKNVTKGERLIAETVSKSIMALNTSSEFKDLTRRICSL